MNPNAVRPVNKYRWMAAMLALCCILLLPGCSFIVDLYVMNLSAKPVVVVCKLPVGQYSQFTYHPAFYPITGSEKNYSLGTETKGVFEADSLIGQLRIELPPGTAVRLGQTMNYYPDLDTLYQWNVEEVQIILPATSDTLRIEGDSLGRHFTEMPGRIYAIPVRN
jgi:hypothetical protein